MSSERVRRAGLVAALSVVTAVLVIGLTFVVQHGSDGETRARDADRSAARASAVRITAFGCSRLGRIGMGAMVEGGVVATVAHVVAGATEITATTVDGRTVSARVVAIDRMKDLALLSVDLDLPRLVLGAPTADTAAAYVVWRSDRAAVVDTTTVRRVALTAPTIDHDATSERQGVQIAAEVVSGDSGSIVVSGGHAVAMVFARSTQSTSRGWATDVAELSPLLERLGDGDPLPEVDVGACT